MATISETIGRIDAERREDSHATLATLQMAPEANVATIDTPAGRLILEPHALRDLAGWLDTPHAGAFLGPLLDTDTPTVRRAATSALVDTLMASAPNRVVLIRSRTMDPARHPNRRTAYAVRSDSYATDINAVDALRAMATAAPGVTPEAAYNAATTRVVATFRGADLPHTAEAKARGDVLAVGARVTTDDRGGASLATMAYVKRLICANGMTGWESSAPARLRHVGRRGLDTRKFARQIQAAMAKARTAADSFAKARGADAWAEYTRRNPGTPNPTPSDVIVAALARHAAVPEISRAATAALVVEAYHGQPYAGAESRTSYTDIANAVTYAAHAATWPGASRWAVEALGGAVLAEGVAVARRTK